MNAPTGYTELSLVGFTDRGYYSASANYVQNDIVRHSNTLWRCLVDDTTGIIPAEGENWTLFLLGGKVIQDVQTIPETQENIIYRTTVEEPSIVTLYLKFETVAEAEASAQKFEDVGFTVTTSGTTQVCTPPAGTVVQNDGSSGVFKTIERVEILYDEKVQTTFTDQTVISTISKTGYEYRLMFLNSASHYYGGNGDRDTVDEFAIVRDNDRMPKDITGRIEYLPQAIREHNLAKYGFKIGDYFKDGLVPSIRYYLAHEDLFFSESLNEVYPTSYLPFVTTPHVAVIAKQESAIGGASWNDEGDASTGYANSDLHKYLNGAYWSIIKSSIERLFHNSLWSDHIIDHYAKLTTSLTAAQWTPVWITALSEIQVTGYNQYGLNDKQIGEAVQQLEIFRRYNLYEIFRGYHYYLRTIAGQDNACMVNMNGEVVSASLYSNAYPAGLILLK